MNNVVIANNYMHDMQSSTNASICGSAPPGGAGCVTANIFIDPGNNGSLPGLQIYNNVVTASGCSGSCNGPSNGGIAVGNSNSVAYTAFVYNNTCDDSGNGRNCFSLDYSGSKGENNIAVGSQYYFWSDVSSPSGLTVDYNDHYNQSVGVNNNGCPGCDTHSISTNPTLNSDYTIPSTSPAKGTGVNLTSLSITGLDTGAPQFFGVSYACGTGCVARPSTGAWDMGAYPYGTSQASAPSCTPTSGNVPQTVTCTNPNSGTTIMCYAASPTIPASNGSGTACTTGTQYTTALSITSPETLNVIAGVAGDTDSSVVSYTYNSAAATGLLPVLFTQIEWPHALELGLP